MSATYFKKVETVATKNGKVAKRKHLVEHPIINLVNCQQISNMVEYTKSISESLGVSEAKMGRGSTLRKNALAKSTTIMFLNKKNDLGNFSFYRK